MDTGQLLGARGASSSRRLPTQLCGPRPMPTPCAHVWPTTRGLALTHQHTASPAAPCPPCSQAHGLCVWGDSTLQRPARDPSHPGESLTGHTQRLRATQDVELTQEGGRRCGQGEGTAAVDPPHHAAPLRPSCRRPHHTVPTLPSPVPSGLPTQPRPGPEQASGMPMGCSGQGSNSQTCSGCPGPRGVSEPGCHPAGTGASTG